MIRRTEILFQLYRKLWLLEEVLTTEVKIWERQFSYDYGNKSFRIHNMPVSQHYMFRERDNDNDNDNNNNNNNNNNK